MFSKQSLRLNFLLKLAAAMAALLLLISLILYEYIRYSVEIELQNSLQKHANYLMANYPNLEDYIKKEGKILKSTLGIEAKIVYIPMEKFYNPFFQTSKSSKKYFLEGYFPYNFTNQKYLLLKYDITKQMQVVNKVYRAIIILNIIGTIFIIIYAYFLSAILIRPIKYFSQKIAAMNEKALKELDLKNIPIEFKPLATSINQLINKIKSFLEYKKELFVGTAHELKTPLAVMKTKSQVALLKRDKNIKSLEDALRQNIKSIDNMNKVIESILEFGRAEGAQFTQSEEIDLIKFIEEIVDEFKLLGESKEITIKKHLHPKSLQIKIQPLLIRQIIQNFLQNAIRFTPPKKQIVVSSYIKDDNFILKIRDEGEGIEEGIDLFAPFKRSKNSPGTGLGLFLVKSAADSIGGKVFINNRKDGKSGAVATFILPLNKNI